MNAKLIYYDNNNNKNNNDFREISYLSNTHHEFAYMWIISNIFIKIQCCIHCDLYLNTHNNYKINVRSGHEKLRINNMRNAIIKIIIIYVN